MQFDNTQSIVQRDNLQTANTNVETHSALCSGSGAAKSLSTPETARDSTKLEFMKFDAETRGRCTAQNVLTEQSELSHYTLRMADSLAGAFQVIFNNHMLKHIHLFTNVEARRALDNEE